MNQRAEKLYKQFLSHVVNIGHLRSMRALLHWDGRTYLPPAGETSRGKQLATLNTVILRERLDAEFISVMEELSAIKGLPESWTINLRDVRRRIERAKRTPEDLLAALSEAESTTHAQWLVARRNNSFQEVEAALAQMVKLKIELAKALCNSGDTLYDTLLHDYDRDEKSAAISKVFAEVRPALQSLVRRIKAATKKSQAKALPTAVVPKARQREILLAILRSMDFREGSVRLDETVHPFCTHLSLDDIRICVRYHEDDLLGTLSHFLHEAGHALYDQGTSREHEHTPLGEACSLSIHESQSLLWERMVGQSRPFWQFIAPSVGDCWSVSPTADDFYREVNHVEPTLIRVGSDEVTYGLHIMIRFELEQRLIDGSLAVKDLPDAWREKYREELGIEPKGDLDGVLQDIHWYDGAIGYFPTYLLGAMNAAELYAAAKQEHPDLEESIAKGEFASLKRWLNTHVHEQGRRFTSKELMTHATGHQPSPKIFIDYLERKYTELYKL